MTLSVLKMKWADRYNGMHLHIMFVLYSVCCSVSVLSCVDVIQSFMNILRAVNLDVTKRRGERARGDTNVLSQIP